MSKSPSPSSFPSSWFLGLLCVAAAFAGGGLVAAAAVPPTPLVRLDAVPFTDVTIADRFWAPRRETNRLASIPVNLDNLEKAKNLDRKSVV